ncbi:lysoplasmalogenase family protein [Corynebacterium breve]|uniref:Lysoplasmalogenase family protein n=1 Tax=Corynebacterium breve TaxID=3049799 RepID=A0ABY8VI83_9CORY|nr:lysoplasmalogenase family protein [Corynebacterium breve]WIM67953.1 lysoplasmalogenase family protein [Corynebacterium breve]
MAQDFGIAEFKARTDQGIEACVASVKKALERPERAGYLVVAESAGWSRLFGWRKLSHVLEPLLPLLLAGEAARAPLDNTQRAALAGGLASGAIGSFEQVRVAAQPSAAGIAGIVGQQAGYVARLVDKRGALTTTSAATTGAVLAAGAGLAAKKNRDLLPATVIGGAATMATVALANDERFRKQSLADSGIGHGANLVAAAEGMRVVRHTLCKDRNDFRTRLLEAVTVATAALGHMLLVDGLASD